MHIYAFGSICRGDVDFNSDVDLLAIVNGRDERFNPSKFSIYSYKRIKEIWALGNPFAWHLATESKMLFSSDSKDFLQDLKEPNPYSKALSDCTNFMNLFGDALDALESGSNSPVFELSTMFLAVRNFASCFALGRLGIQDFSRYSAIRLNEKSVPIDDDVFKIMERARILSTRGTGEPISRAEVVKVLRDTECIKNWMAKLTNEIDE